MTARANRRRRAAASLIRMTLVTTVLLVVYYHAPLNQPGDLRLALWLLAGLLTLGVGVAWQARVIAASDTPRLQALETAGVALPALIVLYASTYMVMSAADPSSFTQVLGRTDALYYTMTVFATVGFGDIAAKSETARVALIVQMLADLALLGAGARVLLGAVRRGQQRRTDSDGGGGAI